MSSQGFFPALSTTTIILKEKSDNHPFLSLVQLRICAAIDETERARQGEEERILSL